ncbi:MAG: ribonuclease III [Thermoleophilia bacterium]|nr:ribonuclease III [Thermoleophilia bacterium]
MLGGLLVRLSDDARLHALTHPAWALSHNESFERLEFLGDSVLGVAISAELYRRFPAEEEGVLSKMKAAVVSGESCALVAREHNLGAAMIAAAPLDADVNLVATLATHERVLAALTESLIGASFLELGYEETATVIVATFADRIGHAVDNRGDAKSELQELAQRRATLVEYELVAADGPDHDRSFTMRARLSGTDIEATGTGRSKKAAGQDAAQQLLERLTAQG